MSATKKIRVLQVDDDDVERERLRRMLHVIDHNVELEEANTLEKARKLLSKNHYDCVLLDYQLPDGIGFELVAAIRTHRAEVCPIILVTMRESEALVVEAMRNGFTDYIVKTNLDPAKLKEVIDHALNWASAERAKQEAENRLKEIKRSRQRKYQKSLRIAVARAENASKAKSIFLANMSHEIRTPMNAVLGFLHLLEKTNLDVNQTELVTKIKTAGKLLLSVINDVLDLSKIEAGELNFDCSSFNIRSTAYEIADLIHARIKEKSLDFEFIFDNQIPEIVIGDQVRIQQIILNILSNAEKFTDSGSIKFHVKPLSVSGESAKIRFMVSDTGVGIAQADIERLFAPFIQVDSSNTRRVGGTGLGLAIVRHLVSLMGGDIGVRSKLGSGSEFWIDLELPVARQNALPDAVPEQQDGPPLQGIRILIADDSILNLEVGTQILEQEGAEVHAVQNGQEAVDILLCSPDDYDVVLMDIQMPVLDGLDAFKQLNEALGDNCPPVIALTAGALTSQRQQINASGMADFVSKPFVVENLVSVIRRQVATKGGKAGASPDGNYEKAFFVPVVPIHSIGLFDTSIERPVVDELVRRVGAKKAADLFLLLESSLRNRIAFTPDIPSTQIAQKIHHFCSQLGFMGFTNLSSACRELENAVLEGEASTEELVAFGAALEQVEEIVRHEIARLREEHAFGSIAV